MGRKLNFAVMADAFFTPKAFDTVAQGKRTRALARIRATLGTITTIDIVRGVRVAYRRA